MNIVINLLHGYDPKNETLLLLETIKHGENKETNIHKITKITQFLFLEILGYRSYNSK